MPVKIRLQRHGKKGKPFYWIVAADGRAKRDGKYLEKIGTYDPNTNPASIKLDVDGAVKWLQNGAQPTDTARAILSYKGAFLKNHLEVGVKKGAITTEQAEEKFQVWVDEKAKAIESKKERLAKAKSDAKSELLKSEKEISDKRRANAVQVQETVEAEAKVVEEKVEEVKETIDDVAKAASEEGKKEVKETVEAEAKIVEEKVEEVKESIDDVAKAATEEGKKEEASE